MKPLIFFKFDINHLSSLSDEYNLEKTQDLYFNKKNFITFNKKIFNYKIKIIPNCLEIFIFGCPIVGTKIDFEGAINLVENYLENGQKKTIERINGQFLIIINNYINNEFIIINDRFNGIPLYYYKTSKNEFIFSSLYYDLIKIININENIIFDNTKILEFLWMNRLMGDANYDQFSKFLLPASIFKYSNNKICLQKYWRPNFKKQDLSKKEFAKLYFYHVKKSVNLMTSDKNEVKYGNFISSGHDSRLLSALIDPKPVNFTLTFSDNLESKTTKQISKILGCEHKHLICSNEHFEKIFNDTVKLSGGLYNFLDAIFFGFEKEVSERVDVAFHGHALDFLHYGNYLPTNFLKIFGSKTFIRRLIKIKKENLVEKYLIYGNPYRQEGINILTLLKDEYKEKYYEKLKKNIQMDLDEAKDLELDNYDSWHYLLIHALGRHFSQINITSKMTNVSIRTPAFENELYDLSFKVKPHLKIKDYHRIYALKKANRLVGKVISANHGFPAMASPAFKTVLLVVRKILRLITGNQKYMSPLLKDRTWPNLNIYLRNSDFFKIKIKELKNNSFIREKIYIIDWIKIDFQIKKWEDGADTDPIFLFSLLTLQEFFKNLNEKN